MAGVSEGVGGDTGPSPFGCDEPVNKIDEEKRDRDQIAMRESRMQADRQGQDRTGQNRNSTRTKTRMRLF